jgi:DNA polymerase V
MLVKYEKEIDRIRTGVVTREELTKAEAPPVSLEDAKKRFETKMQANGNVPRHITTTIGQITVASAVYVHINTSWYKKDGSYVSEGKTRGLTFPTSSTPEIIRTALALLREIYREGLPYKKAAVMLLDLQNAVAVKSQGVLFEPDDKSPNDRDRDDRLMESVDQINRALGRGTLFFGSQGIERQWRSASNLCSPNYTLHFTDLPVAKAK